MNKLIVISGCSSGGKSTLLDELKKHGYSVIPEVGREIVKEQFKINGTITPWENPVAFCELAIQRSIANFNQASKTITTVDQILFFDRSFLDGISYYQTLELDNTNKYDHIIHDLRFYPTVFMRPPWVEIYQQDNERKHSFDDAVAEHERLLKFYSYYGYQIIEIPKVDVKERLQFITSMIL